MMASKLEEAVVILGVDDMVLFGETLDFMNRRRKEKGIQSVETRTDPYRLVSCFGRVTACSSRGHPQAGVILQLGDFLDFITGGN